MKKFIYIIALLFLLVACNEELQIDTKQPTIGNKTRAFTSQTFSFDSVTKPEIWKTFQTLEEMQSACQIPDDVLPNLSTEELVQICMDYPLFGNFSAYNDELVGIKKVMDGFNGFTELKKRTDAAEKLLDLYENVNVATLNSDKENIETYPNIKLGYLELILSSGEFESLYQGNLLQRLNILHEKKFNEKRISNNNSFFSLRHSELLQNKIQESNAKVSLKVRIFTKCGKPLIAYIISEMTFQEIAELNSFTIKTYPNATFLSNSSATYNCHSYAWNVSDGGKKYWINESSISKYWTDDYYSETTEDNAVKINYYDSDHSAVVSSVKDMYESKWGSCPLMRHAPNYGPYENMEKRKYYKHFYRSDLISCEGTNNGIIKTNIDYTYSIIKDIPTGNYVRYRWSIIDGKEDDATGNDKATLDYNEKNPSAIINIKQPGLYTINCEIYLSTTGEVLGDAMYQPLVEN